MKLTLIEGLDKSVSTRMVWKIEGTNFVITRYVSGSNYNFYRDRTPKWSATKDGLPVFIPRGIRRHEVTIAKYLLSLNEETIAKYRR